MNDSMNKMTVCSECGFPAEMMHFRIGSALVIMTVICTDQPTQHIYGLSGLSDYGMSILTGEARN
jgi:hypothetical protein